MAADGTGAVGMGEAGTAVAATGMGEAATGMAGVDTGTGAAVTMGVATTGDPLRAPEDLVPRQARLADR